MALDAHRLLVSLELAGGLTVGFLFFMSFIFLAAIPRLRNRWKAYQPAQIQLNGPDPVTICKHLLEVLGPFGFEPVGVPGGTYTLQPTGLWRRSGATPISVEFLPEGGALVTGQARYLAKLTADRKVWFLTEGSVPFWPWVRKKLTKTFILLTAILFVALFCVGMMFMT